MEQEAWTCACVSRWLVGLGWIVLESGMEEYSGVKVELHKFLSSVEDRTG